MTIDTNYFNDDATLYYGEVVWFNKGIGFIEWNINGVKQKDQFVHYSGIACDGYKNLFKGQKVSFNIGVNHQGKPKAINVVVLNN